MRLLPFLGSTALLLLLSLLLATPSSGQTAELISKLSQLPDYKGFTSYFGMYASGIEFNSIHMTTYKTRFVTSAQNFKGLVVWNDKIFYFRSQGFFSYDWDDGLVILRSVVSEIKAFSLCAATHGLYFYSSPYEANTRFFQSLGTPDTTQEIPDAPPAITAILVENDITFVLSKGIVQSFNPSTSNFTNLTVFCSGVNANCGTASDFITLKGITFFKALNRTENLLWRTDGTPEGTYKFCTTPVCQNSTSFMTVGDKLGFFVGSNLYTIDLNATVTLVKTLPSQILTTAIPDTQLEIDSSTGKRTYFLTQDSVLGNCSYLWSTQGTPETTKNVTTFCYSSLISDNSTGTNQTISTKFYNVGYLKHFRRPDSSLVFTMQAAARIQGVAITAANDVHFLAYDASANTAKGLVSACSSCNAKSDLSHYFDGYIWFFSQTGLYRLTYSTGDSNAAAGLEGSLSAVFLAALLAVVVLF